MIVIFKSNIDESDALYQETLSFLTNLPNIQAKLHQVQGTQKLLTEVYLVGDTGQIAIDSIKSLPAVDKVVRVSQEYRMIGRHKPDQESLSFTYQGITFSQDEFQLFAGLCAVDTAQHVEQTMKKLQELGLECTRMGAYKPRTSPYSFQGHGKECLPYVFELAGKYGIKIIAMEVTHEAHIEEINSALTLSGNATGVMLQIGTRNTQNFELLKAVGRQQEYPILMKRGFGITLDESLNAAEYLANSGNNHIVFCLRGMKSQLGNPHRNFVDFAHVPTIKRLTRIPVCIDPSHSVGIRASTPDKIQEIFHTSAQGVVAGANMILVDVHPNPTRALVDGPQALTLPELNWFNEDMKLVRSCYQSRINLASNIDLNRG